MQGIGTAAALVWTAGPPETGIPVVHFARQRVLAWSAALVLRPADSSARTARMSVTAQLAAWDRSRLTGDTGAVTAELVANAVTASAPAGTPVRLGMILTESSVLVEVFDCAPGEPVAVAAAPDAESGRGLRIVAALSRQWGWIPLRSSKVVWAEVPA